MPRGIKFKCTEENAIKVLILTGGVTSKAAKKLGVDSLTLRRFIEKSPKLTEIARECKEALIDLAEDVVLTELKAKNLDAAKFVLRCHGKARGWVERTDLGLGDGATVNITFVPALIDKPIRKAK